MNVFTFEEACPRMPLWPSGYSMCQKQDASAACLACRRVLNILPGVLACTIRLGGQLGSASGCLAAVAVPRWLRRPSLGWNLLLLLGTSTLVLRPVHSRVVGLHWSPSDACLWLSACSRCAGGYVCWWLHTVHATTWYHDAGPGCRYLINWLNCSPAAVEEATAFRQPPS